MLQNSDRSRHETLAVATAFRDIRRELVNNRIDTEELKTRLEDGIAFPLDRIATFQFPRLKKHLTKLEGSLERMADAKSAQAVAVAETDAILVQMKQVLAKMIELETFHQVLDMLRAVIEAHEHVSQETKIRRQEERKALEE